MALVLCFHFQLGVLRGLNMSVVSERMSLQSCSVSPSCKCLFIVYSITNIWCEFVCIYVHLNLVFSSCCFFFHVNFSGTKSLAAIHFWINLIGIHMCTHFNVCVLLCARSAPLPWPKHFQSEELEVGQQYLEQWASRGTLYIHTQLRLISHNHISPYLMSVSDSQRNLDFLFPRREWCLTTLSAVTLTT